MEQALAGQRVIIMGGTSGIASPPPASLSKPAQRLSSPDAIRRSLRPPWSSSGPVPGARR